MSLQPVLIAGDWRQAHNPTGWFNAVNPATKSSLPESYPVSGMDDVEEALAAGQETVALLRRIPVEKIASFLERVCTVEITRGSGGIPKQGGAKVSDRKLTSPPDCTGEVHFFDEACCVVPRLMTWDTRADADWRRSMSDLRLTANNPRSNDRGSSFLVL